MSTGYGNRLTRQIGEHLVVAKLGRLGVLATPFAGNVPDYDLLASDLSGHSLPLQIKTIKSGAWQFNAKSFLVIDLKGDSQFIKGKAELLNGDLIYVFVILDQNEDDTFFVLIKKDLQEIVYKNYTCKAKNGVRVRPKNPKSTHCAVHPEDLERFRDKWELITRHFDPIR